MKAVDEHSLKPLGPGLRLEQRTFDLGSITLVMRPSHHLLQPHEPLELLVLGLLHVKHGCEHCS